MGDERNEGHGHNEGHGLGGLFRRDPLERIADAAEELVGRVDLMSRVDRIEQLILRLLKEQGILIDQEKENQKMAETLGQQILDAMTAESTRIGSLIQFVQGLKDNNTIDETTKNQIFDIINKDSVRIDAAMAANVVTPPAPSVGSIAGVVTLDGNPFTAGGAIVNLVDSAGATSSATVDSTGAFGFSSVPTGSGTVSIVAPDGVHADSVSQPVSISAGGVTNVSFALVTN